MSSCCGKCILKLGLYGPRPRFGSRLIFLYVIYLLRYAFPSIVLRKSVSRTGAASIVSPSAPNLVFPPTPRVLTRKSATIRLALRDVQVRQLAVGYLAKFRSFVPEQEQNCKEYICSSTDHGISARITCCQPSRTPILWSCSSPVCT